jgi:low affinity Fe/Cu permease
MKKNKKLKHKYLQHGGGFSSFARKIAYLSGQPATFVTAVLVIVGWASMGPVFHFSDTWQLVINTSTTIITFLMVFLIQNTQNRDSQAMQLKLDELIRAFEGAHTALIDLEELTDEEIVEIRNRYLKLASKGRSALRSGKTDTVVPPIETFGQRGGAPLDDES